MKPIVKFSLLISYSVLMPLCDAHINKNIYIVLILFTGVSIIVIERCLTMILLVFR